MKMVYLFRYMICDQAYFRMKKYNVIKFTHMNFLFLFFKKLISSTLSLYFLQKVQKELLKSDVHSKSDKSPVTVADYGMVSTILCILFINCNLLTSLSSTIDHVHLEFL